MSTGWIVVIVLAAVIAMAVVRMRVVGSNASDAKEKIAQGASVIDVRTPAEYASGHFNGAKNIPLAELQARVSEIGDKQKPIVVYCASGMRSAHAARILTASGFTDVTNAGGLASLGQ